MTEIHVSSRSKSAASEIFDRYAVWLGGEHHGNQDRECCIDTIALIIEKHTDSRALEFLSQALNEGDGVYRP